MDPTRLVFRVHALRRMFERSIRPEDVGEVLAAGEVIMGYPEDSPFPSRLVLGWRGSRPIHVVAADNPRTGETIVISSYEPDPRRWSADFRRRRTT